ncbi:hypothetical protein HMPREF0290_0165, partial [Corynebacterium efficiens YS-314]
NSGSSFRNRHPHHIRGLSAGPVQLTDPRRESPLYPLNPPMERAVRG